jgi:signal transduction histidine kinase
LRALCAGVSIRAFPVPKNPDQSDPLIVERLARQRAEALLRQRETELAEVRAALRALQTTMEQKVEARTGELSLLSERLAAAAGAAEVAAQAKNEFLANISHEIRTPMTAILGYSDLLLEPDAAAHAPEIVATIRRNGDHLLSIIDHILELSVLETSHSGMIAERFDPVAIAQGVIAQQTRGAASRGITLKTEHNWPLPEAIESDPSRVRQILMNLVSNAVKFTPRGSVTLRMSVTQGVKPAMQFKVIDTGIGMSDEEVAGLFRPFAQGDGSSSRRFGGTGLGLVISKRFAELLGGEITLTTRRGEGSVFTLTIPCGSLAGVPLRWPHQDAAPAVAGSIGVAGGLRPGCRVLLAEDCPDNQRLIAMHLRKNGAQVEVVENGRLAVERALDALAKGEAFDVILMDMQMPEMDGYTATQTLRRRGYARPILALTAHAMSTDRAKCLDAGCDEYATKPVDAKALVGMVRTWSKAA